MTKPVKLVTRLPRSSTAVTSTAGVIVAPGAVLLGWTVNTSCVAWGGGGGAVMSNPALVAPVSPAALAVNV